MKYIITILYIIVLEFIWIYLINYKNYANVTKMVQKTDMKVNITYALIAYILVFTSIFFLAIPFSSNYISKNEKKNKLYI